MIAVPLLAADVAGADAGAVAAVEMVARALTVALRIDSWTTVPVAAGGVDGAPWRNRTARQ